MDWSFLKTDGRMRRTTFGIWCLVLTFVWPMLYALPTIVSMEDDALGGVLGFAVTALGLHVSWCVAVRRAHDMGRSWTFVALTWTLLCASAVLTVMFLFVIFASEGRGGLSIAVAAVVGGSGGLVMAGLLSLAPPVESECYGPDPR